MRCGFVRLVTRRCPYDVKIKRKTWSSSQRAGETGALTSVAESKLIGRYCAHKMCRLFEKSSKIVCKMLSTSDITKSKILAVKSPSFDHLNTSNIKCVKVKNFNDNVKNNISVRISKSRLNNLASHHNQSSQIVIRLQNYSTNDVKSTVSKTKPVKPSHTLFKQEFCPYKRYSAQRITSKRSVSHNLRYENYNRHIRGSILRNKVIPSRRLYPVQSPFLTNFPDEYHERYINELKHKSSPRYGNIENCDKSPRFLNHNVLNHLNETSYLSLCGCDICDRKLKDYEKKNCKINRLLQNKISKILNYCKKKNPFYKIYAQNEKNKRSDYLREFGMCGVNGWLNYLDACECTDWNQYTQNRDKANCTHNKCVNTSDEKFNIEKYQKDTFETDGVDRCTEDYSCKDPKLSNIKETCVNDEKKKFQRECVFDNKDNSMTQTLDLTEPQVTNYYYITNNTLNTNCCCKEECYNETDPTAENNLCQHDLKQAKGCNQNICSNEINSNKHEGNEKCDKTKRKTNIKLKTINKVYDVIMKPINKNEIFKLSNLNVDDSIKPLCAELKACNANNFEYKDCESNQPDLTRIDRGDVPQQSTQNEKVLNFDEFMEMKCRELKENSIVNSFRYLNDTQFNEIAKESFKNNESEPTKENILGKSSKPIIKETNKSTTNEFERLKSSENAHSKIKTNEEDIDQCTLINSAQGTKRNEQEIRMRGMKCDNMVLGPTDHLNQYMANMNQRYEEKAHIISRGPDFSQFPPGDWRDPLLLNEKQLSKTYDVSNPYEGSAPIKITQDKTKDLSKYSEINIAIQKVKKKIHDIINESNESITVHKDPAVKQQRVKQVKCYRQKLSKQLKPSVYNQMELINNLNYRDKSDKGNYVVNEKHDYSESQKKRIKRNKKFEGRYNKAIKKTDHPPSSVHLNDIIEAIKETRNSDKYYDEQVTDTNKKEVAATRNKKCKSSQAYGRYLAQCSMRQIAKRNSIFAGNPYPESIFGIINKDDLLSVASISRNMSTSSKYRPFLRYTENKTNKKQCKSNFMDGTIFSTDNLVSEGQDNEKTTKARKKEAYLKYMENKMKQKMHGYKVYEQNPPNIVANNTDLELSTEGYADYQKNCQEELIKKSLDLFSENTRKDNIRKTEYSIASAFPGRIDRCNVRHFSGRKPFNRNENQIDNVTNDKYWKICDPKDYGNRADNCHTEMISKGFRNTETDDVNCQSPEGNEIIFNERLEKTVQTVSELDDNCTGTKAVMNNDTGRRFDRFNCRPNNRSSADNSYCINVGDLGLNFTSFALGKVDERENKKGKGGVERSRRDDQGKSVHGSESRINNVGVANMSMSRQADLHLRETRTVGLRPCNKNEVPPISFRIRNSFLMDSKNTLRPVTATNTLYRRQVSSGTLDSGNFKSDMADKLKNIKKIDQVDYTREEKSLTEKETVQTIKIKESYLSPSNKNEISLETEAFSATKNYPGMGVCSKELEKRTKNKRTGDSILKKQITEEMNIAGLFPEGKKSVHGKIVSVLNKPKKKSTLNSSNNIEDPMTATDFKDPITVHVLYETTTDHSVEEHIDKAKRKVYIGDIKKKQRTPVKPLKTNELKSGNETNTTQEPIVKSQRTELQSDNTENELDDNKSRIWKKYDQKQKEIDNKKYFVELKTLNKNKWNSSDDSILDNSKEPEKSVAWQAPRNRVIDKLTNRGGLKNEWVQGKEINAPKKNRTELATGHELDDRNIVIKDFSARCDTNSKTLHIDGLTSEEKMKKLILIKKLSNFTNLGEIETTKSIKQDEVGLLANSEIKDEFRVNRIESKIEKPTRGESKYEIDSDNLNDNSGTFDENEKLVITHFKQFPTPEMIDSNKSSESKKSDNVVLEASMLKVTMVHNSTFDKKTNTIELQSIENLSNDVERELNDIVLPYIKDLIIKEESRENKETQEKDKLLFKPKEYFINMLTPKIKAEIQSERTITTRNIKNEKETRGTEVEPIDDILDDSGIKISSDSTIKGISDRGKHGRDLSQILRSSIEQLYMKQVSFLISEGRNDHLLQIRAAMEKLYTKKNTLTSTSETEGKENVEGFKIPITEDVPVKSSEILARDIQKDSLTLNTDMKNEDVQENEGQKKSRTPAKDESVVMEIKQNFVKEESIQTDEGFTDLEAKSSKADEPEALNSSINITEDSKNKVAELIEQKAEEITKKPSDPTKFNTEKQVASTSDLLSEINEESTKLSTDKESAVSPKPSTKSYYSYDSTVKPILKDPTTNKVNVGYKDKNSTDSAEIKDEVQELKGETADNKMDLKNKSDTPISKPLETKKSPSWYYPTIKPKAQEKEAEPVLNERSIEEIKPQIEVKNETNERREIKPDKGTTPNFYKPFKAKSQQTPTERSGSKYKREEKVPAAKPKVKKPRMASSYYSYDSTIMPALPKSKSDQNIAVKAAEKTPLVTKKDEVKLPEQEDSELNERNVLLEKDAVQTTLKGDAVSKDTQETEERVSEETKLMTEKEKINVISAQASKDLIDENKDVKSKDDKELENVEDSKNELDNYEIQVKKDEIRLKQVISDDAENNENRNKKHLTQSERDVGETLLKSSKTKTVDLEKESSKEKYKANYTKEPQLETEVQAKEKPQELKIEDREKKKSAAFNLKKLYSKEIIVEDAEEIPKTETIEKVKQEKKEDTEPVEEQFEILSSSFNQYQHEDKEQDVEERSTNLVSQRYKEKKQDKVKFLEETKTETTKKYRETKKETKQELSTKPLPASEPRHFVPYEREKTQQQLAIEAWEKEPTYMKNLSPTYFKLKKKEMRSRNYEENEKTFKNLRTLNKITTMGRVSDCSCSKKEKWTADMCCSYEGEKDKTKEINEDSTDPEQMTSDQASNRPTVLRSGRGYRSSDWPENISKKKESVIKQPLSPSKPPWRN